MLYCDSSVCESSVCKVITNQGLLKLDVDVLALVALENQVSEENVERIRASCLLEVANGPVDLHGDAVLPDVLVNSGRVTVSYFEWLQNRSGLHWEEAEMTRRLKKTMEREADHIFKATGDEGVSLRTAAYLHGVKRIVGAILEQGTEKYFAQDPG